jgi:hypothetical protein
MTIANAADIGGLKFGGIDVHTDKCGRNVETTRVSNAHFIVVEGADGDFSVVSISDGERIQRTASRVTFAVVATAVGFSALVVAGIIAIATNTNIRITFVFTLFWFLLPGY